MDCLGDGCMWTSFAGALKLMCSKVFDYPYNLGKDTRPPFFCLDPPIIPEITAEDARVPADQLRSINDLVRNTIIFEKYIVTVGRLLQIVGEAFRLHAGPDYWIKELDLDYRAGLYLVIDDVRYENEVDAIVSRGGAVYRVVRPGIDEPRDGRVCDHPSERSGTLKVSGTIVNDGSLEDLKRKVVEMLIIKQH